MAEEVKEQEELVNQNEFEKNEVEKKINKQIAKKQEKDSRLGFYNLFDYIKEEHKWETFLFLFIAIFVLDLGMLILTGALSIRDDFPVLGGHAPVVGWVLVVVGALAIVYSIWPFIKPAFPEIRKVTWLTMPKFLANAFRTFLFITIFVALFILYDALITGILAKILQ
ncbi:MAG: preprotein translocase subunit SecE [Acholeplasmatales bacterium]|nr:preprotein translocase subunit SecE [Acholeplasmatales bacterium]